MRLKPQTTDTLHLFHAHFQQILDPNHALMQLADEIDWPRFDAAFAESYSEDLGAPGKAIRLMAGLHYLKYAFSESDESLIARSLAETLSAAESITSVDHRRRQHRRVRGQGLSRSRMYRSAPRAHRGVAFKGCLTCRA